ncbi:hypothetical protein GGH13_005201 [Coemansia sp. S155-1]|nr:hypothetical protein H4S03_003280 [Coemansia sp. S3946]KAJ2067713.1 hypothetical protein GGH13_005201 [Coemansia sp. S155-1]
MEHNNIYIYHRGVGESVLAKPILFVFPYSKTLTESDMSRFLVSELNKKAELAGIKTKIRFGWIGDKIIDKDVVQQKSKRTVMFAFPHGCGILFNVSPMEKFLTLNRGRKNNDIRNKIDEMINLYANTVAGKSPSEVESLLEARDIIYYDAQKAAGVRGFDKRSPEGKAIIQAKRVVQRQKLLTQRGYSISAKRREVRIGMSRLSLHDNLGGSSVCVE